MITAMPITKQEAERRKAYRRGLDADRHDKNPYGLDDEHRRAAWFNGHHDRWVHHIDAPRDVLDLIQLLLILIGGGLLFWSLLSRVG